MTSAHARPRPRADGRRAARLRLLVIALAPVAVLAPLAAFASGVTHHTVTVSHGSHKSTTRNAGSGNTGSGKAVPAVAASRLMWSKSFNPALALLSNYTKSGSTTAGFLALPLSYHTLASQEATATATFRTRWVDVKALLDGPNISQQGLSIQPSQFKLQIMHGATPASHRGNCHLQGATGHELAFGPSVDVADGRWHTITCVKFPDTRHGTEVLVIVDGVAGKPGWSSSPIGNIEPTGMLRLGGRSTLASSDSLDGWISSLQFWLAG
jgi:hypothetical protein